MTIGQLARRVGIRPSAIRYYEAQGVLRPPARSASEYRLYGSDAVSVLRFVQRAKELGFSLDEVRQLIKVSRDEPPCTLCRTLIDHHLAQVEGELRRLRSLRDRLKLLSRQPTQKASLRSASGRRGSDFRLNTT
ncbi:MAG: MerR family transcriptional regulator, partial [Pseudomonadota bacterium]|nr:MerR family transcriptional regulator [Pseudomonadota bacterium]